MQEENRLWPEWPRIVLKGVKENMTVAAKTKYVAILKESFSAIGKVMKSKRNCVITFGLMGCSLLGIGVAELAWGLLFAPYHDPIYDVLTPVIMIILGAILLAATNRISLEDKPPDK